MQLDSWLEQGNTKHPVPLIKAGPLHADNHRTNKMQSSLRGGITHVNVRVSLNFSHFKKENSYKHPYLLNSWVMLLWLGYITLVPALLTASCSHSIPRHMPRVFTKTPCAPTRHHFSRKLPESPRWSLFTSALTSQITGGHVSEEVWMLLKVSRHGATCLSVFRIPPSSLFL